MKQQIRICLFGAGFLTVLIIFIVLGVKVSDMQKSKNPQTSMPTETEDKPEEMQAEIYKYIFVFPLLRFYIESDDKNKLEAIKEFIKTNV